MMNRVTRTNTAETLKSSQTRASKLTGKQTKQSGFSLIELIAVVAILGLLAAVVAPKIFGQPGKARIAKAKTEISGIQSALQMYKLENFNYPSSEQGLMALVEQPNGEPEAPNWQDGGYLDRLPKDPWGKEYLYVSCLLYTSPSPRD